MRNQLARHVSLPGTTAGQVALLLAVSLILRGPLFGQSFLNLDPAEFALVAREILHGNWPYTAVFDHKPIGLYLHFAAAFALLGDSPLVTRVLGWAIVSGTAIALRAIFAGPMGLSQRLALLLACAFLLASTGLDGQATMAEHFVNLYAVLSVLFLLREGRMACFLAGASAGIAVNCDYLGAPVIAGLILGHIASSDQARRLGRIATFALFAAGATVATALLLTPLVLFSNVSDYFGPQVAFLSGYASDSTAKQVVVAFVMETSPLVPLVVSGLATLFLRTGSGEAVLPSRSGTVPTFAAMSIGAVLAIPVSRYVWDNYVLLLLPPLWLWGAAILAGAKDRSQRVLLAAAIAGSALMIGASGLLLTARGVEDLIAKAHGDQEYDQPRELAEIAASRLSPGETIYVACSSPVLYQLLDVRPPTRYAFAPLIFHPRWAAALGVDPDAELRSIFAQRPAVVILGDPDHCWFAPPATTWREVKQALEANGYVPFARFEGFSFFAPPAARNEAR